MEGVDVDTSGTPILTNRTRFAAERIEFIVGLGETLYFEQAAGAAAAVFESVLLSFGDLSGESRERVLDCVPQKELFCWLLTR